MDLSAVKFLAPKSGRGKNAGGKARGNGKMTRKRKAAAELKRKESALRGQKEKKKKEGSYKERGGKAHYPHKSIHKGPGAAKGKERGGGKRKAASTARRPAPAKPGAKDPFKAADDLGGGAHGNSKSGASPKKKAKGAKPLTSSVMGLRFMANVKRQASAEDDERELLERARVKQAAAISFLGEANARFVCVRDDAVGNELGGRVRSSGRRSFTPRVVRETVDEGGTSVTASQMADRFAELRR